MRRLWIERRKWPDTPHLDVIPWTDGRIELADRDEFEMHRVKLRYPDDIVQAALAQAEEALDAVHGGHEPFAGSAAARWARGVTSRP